MIEPKFLKENEELKSLIKTLCEWIGSVVVHHRIVVRDLAEDLADGYVLQRLVEQLFPTACTISDDAESGKPNVLGVRSRFTFSEYLLNETSQKLRLQEVLKLIEERLGLTSEFDNESNALPWSLEDIFTKQLVPILRLVITLARHVKAPIFIPPKLMVQGVYIKKLDGGIIKADKREFDICETVTTVQQNEESDPFDTLFEMVKQGQLQDKLQLVQESLLAFANTPLARLDLMVEDLIDFSDGVYFIMLLGIFQDYFVPLYEYTLTPETFEQKLENVKLAMRLADEAGVKMPPESRCRAADVALGDRKSILRLLFAMFTKFQHDRRFFKPSAPPQQEAAADAAAEAAAEPPPDSPSPEEQLMPDVPPQFSDQQLDQQQEQQ